MLNLVRRARRTAGAFRCFLRTAPLWDDQIGPIARFFLRTTRLDIPCDTRVRFQFQGKPFLTRSRDWGGFEEILLDHEYLFVEKLLRGQSGLVLDIGANIGLFALYLLSTNTDLDIHSVEAERDTFELLKANQQLNPSLPWSVHRYALSGSDGSIRFHSEAASTSGRVAQAGESGEDVPAIRWDTFRSRFIPQKPIALVKMDIEGAEESVLMNCSDDLAQVNHLVIEVHPNRCNADKVIAWIRRVYPYVYQVKGRTSSKPLLVTSRTALTLPELETY